MTVFCNLSSPPSPSLNAKAASNRKFAPKPMHHNQNEKQADSRSATSGSVTRKDECSDSGNSKVNGNYSTSGTPRSTDTESTCSVTMATVGSPDDKDTDDCLSTGGSLAPVDLTKRVGSILSRSSSDGSANSTSGGGGTKKSADLSMPTLKSEKPKTLIRRQNSEATHQVTNLTTDVEAPPTLPSYRRQSSLSQPSPSTGRRKHPWETDTKATTRSGAAARSGKSSAISAPVTVIKTSVQSSPSQVDDGYRGDDDNTTISTLGTPTGTGRGGHNSAATGNGSPLAAATAAAAAARALLAAKRRDALLEEAAGKRKQDKDTSTAAEDNAIVGSSRRPSTATSYYSSGEDADSLEVMTPPCTTHYVDDGEEHEEEDFSVYDMDADDSVVDAILGDDDITEDEEEDIKEEASVSEVSLHDACDDVQAPVLQPTDTEFTADDLDSHARDLKRDIPLDEAEPGNEKPRDKEEQAVEDDSLQNSSLGDYFARDDAASDGIDNNCDVGNDPVQASSDQIENDISLLRGWSSVKQTVERPNEKDGEGEEEADPIQEGREEIEQQSCSPPSPSPRRGEDDVSLFRGWSTPKPAVVTPRPEQEEEESDPIEQGRDEIESVLSGSNEIESVLSGSNIILCSASPGSSTASDAPSASVQTRDEDAFSRALTELSDEIEIATATSSAASATSTSKTTKKEIDIASAGLPLLYLGPIDISRPERYASLGHCVHEALRVHYKQCATNESPSDVLILHGPAPSVRHDHGDNVWIAPIPCRGIDACRSGASVASSQRSWAPVDVDSGTNEISSISDVRRAHSGVAAALAGSQPEEAVSVLDDLLSCLEHQDREQQLEWLTGTGSGSSQLVNELNYSKLIEFTRKNLSIVQIYARQYSSASSNLQDIVRANPEDIISHSQLGLALIGANHLKDAAAVFGDVLIKLDRLEKADEQVQGIECISQAKGVVLNNLGCCFLKRSEFERARSVLQRALATLLSSEDASDHQAKIALTLCNLGKTLVQTKEFDTALDTLNTAIEYIKDTPHMEEHYLISTMRAKALVAASVKQFMAAIKIYEEMIEILERSENDDEILSVITNMKAIASELSKHTASGAKYQRMLEARENEVRARMEARLRSSVAGLDLLT